MSHEQFLLANLVAQLCWPTFVGRVTSALDTGSWHGGNIEILGRCRRNYDLMENFSDLITGIRLTIAPFVPLKIVHKYINLTAEKVEY